MSWTWRLETAEGTTLSEPPAPAQPTQSDAESWLGETWRELAEAGVAQASLFEDGVLVYGPMSLSE
jgi:hypothetical protein